MTHSLIVGTMNTNVKFKGIVCLLLSAALVNGSKEIMKSLTLNFSKALDICKAEMNLDDQIMQDFNNFWKEDYLLVHNELGCAIMCLANKLDLVDEDSKVHQKNTHSFATKHGADDDVARHIVEILHECEKIVYSQGIVDDCTVVLEIAKCFRTRIHALEWAPTMEVVLEEVITDIQ